MDIPYGQIDTGLEMRRVRIQTSTWQRGWSNEYRLDGESGPPHYGIEDEAT